MPDSNLTFEEALKQLEDIVEKLDQTNMSLDDAILAYEKGSELKKICEERLKQAQLKVDKIQTDGKSPEILGTQPFDSE